MEAGREERLVSENACLDFRSQPGGLVTARRDLGTI